ncbi:MAG: PP2C family protein-serine/threonine phosphatase [Streptosporangiaceae bacterium]
MTLALHYAARSDVGLLREGNEDSGYAGPRLLAVADGVGGQAHGEVASAVAIATLAPLDEDVPGSDLLGVLERSVRGANDELRRMVETDQALASMGTTLTAMLWSGGRVALAHVGDSRAYLLREGGLHQITRDHTLVQSLIDEGRITEDEAATHPQRSLILRALDGHTDVEPDLSIREALPGDRYLLCSDGLSSVVSTETINQTLRGGDDLDEVVRRLIELANRGGGPDNITCVVADVIDTSLQGPPPPEHPIVVGAAQGAVRRRENSPDTSAGRAAALTQTEPDEHEGGPGDPPRRRRWPFFYLAVLIFVVGLALAGYGGWQYTRSQYYVGAQDGEVVIYRGLSQHVVGYDLSAVHSRTDVPLGDLPVFERDLVVHNIEAGSLGGAQKIVDRLRGEATACRHARHQAEQAQKSKEAKKAKKARHKNAPGDKASARASRDRPGTTPSPRTQSTPKPGHTPSVPGIPNGCPEGA